MCPQFVQTARKVELFQHFQHNIWKSIQTKQITLSHTGTMNQSGGQSLRLIYLTPHWWNFCTQKILHLWFNIKRRIGWCSKLITSMFNHQSWFSICLLFKITNNIYKIKKKKIYFVHIKNTLWIMNLQGSFEKPKRRRKVIIPLYIMGERGEPAWLSFNYFNCVFIYLTPDPRPEPSFF